MMKLVFATSDQKIISRTKEGENKYHDIIVFVEINDIGTYIINFNKQEVGFYYGKILHRYADNTLMVEFDEETDLIPHETCKGVYHTDLIWNVGSSGSSVVAEEDGRWKIIADYLEGDIDKHSHDHGVREAYLSIKEPYFGKVCGYYEEHSSNDVCPNGESKLIAVKAIPLIWEGFIPQK